MPIYSELTVSIIMQYFPKNLESIIQSSESRIQSPESDADGVLTELGVRRV